MMKRDMHKHGLEGGYNNKESRESCTKNKKSNNNLGNTDSLNKWWKGISNKQRRRNKQNLIRAKISQIRNNKIYRVTILQLNHPIKVK